MRHSWIIFLLASPNGRTTKAGAQARQPVTQLSLSHKFFQEILQLPHFKIFFPDFFILTKLRDLKTQAHQESAHKPL